jgi:hypothetical protein
MYTDEDLNFAIKKGVFTEDSVKEFRDLVSSLQSSPSVDEENFKLIGGFNDIFIVIACALLLFSSLWVLKPVNASLAIIVFTILSWSLSEFFVRKRKMALPAIVLLLSFVGGVYASAMSFFHFPSEGALITAAAASTVAAYLHWLRFRVPITIAAGTAAAIGLLVSVTLSVFPGLKDWLLLIIFIGGLVSFLFAMYWDASDTKRTTHKSDVAFWLHLLSAPLVIHPIFSSLGVLDGNESFVNMAIVIVLYLLMTSISIAIDRRAFMVSSLIYVLYAISTLIKTYGGIGYSFAITGVLMGGALLMLSAFWHPSRAYMVSKLPHKIKKYVPEVV